VAGYYGTLAEWIDFPLLAALADRFPGVTFALIGPVEVSPAALPERPNLRWIGPQPYPTLPAWLARFTVCLLPFHVDGFTRAINPVKLYEYFASGKPVVSTPLPEVLAFGDLVYVGAGLDGMTGALRAALAEQARSDLAARRRAAAAANTWDQRVGRVVHLLHTLPPS
jgi:glycosyltransferase involved in cell wall biosynthesis